MKHEMKLKAQFFNYIKNGTKRIELRLNDEKRRKIKLGDTIKFCFTSFVILHTKVKRIC